MKTNKLDQQIKKKFENRTFEPSASAWERLSVQLDEQPKQKKIGWFFYIGVAASILLLVTIGVQLFSKDSSDFKPVKEVVVKPVDKNSIDSKIEEFINEIPVEEALVKEEIDADKFSKSEDKIVVKNSVYKKKTKKIATDKRQNKGLAIVDVEPEVDKKKQQIDDIKKASTIKKGYKNSKIKVNAEDLLFAVTHTSQEVKQYYAKYNMDRDAILNTIKIELKKSNLKVNPNTILAEVERTIDDDDFQNNFLKSLKSKVSDIASAIASRND
ncbi:hypothetical protein [Polaribacter sp. MED152]|uniref:hypothetical protein n=1 Tax=Polaribacter sp. MED152 TaxID=313598 RepID=UPI000068CC55|nr:hypothetical protein [Polaribacter sp. MED152]EAQ41526.1 hypothetical protein MED152_02390 [Polaribacter sp. MED152]